ncbi:uncharacterized protein BX664DRAFT_385221 [Halteromyces radiatus]|uniref:uncharacterized protein n=1 Tax=Halteromyces radiatus TaxID=101107 RepID=UPI0022206DAC|nr:uncharacterized protein BX664DRAFT_385221 [Halteromyces radiatus]KAI8093876.1 hypothetical protein BX664DRAFT_385221 [Halteromyces radiatus]
MNDYYEDLKADPKSFFSNINNALRKGGYRGVFKNGNIFAQVMTEREQLQQQQQQSQQQQLQQQQSQQQQSQQQQSQQQQSQQQQSQQQQSQQQQSQQQQSQQQQSQQQPTKRKRINNDPSYRGIKPKLPTPATFITIANSVERIDSYGQLVQNLLSGATTGTTTAIVPAATTAVAPSDLIDLANTIINYQQYAVQTTITKAALMFQYQKRFHHLKNISKLTYSAFLSRCVQHLADEDKDDAMTKINDMVKKCSIYGDLVEAAGGPWILCLADLYPDSYLTKVSKGAMVRAAESLCIDGLRTEFGSRFAGLFF